MYVRACSMYVRVEGTSFHTYMEQARTYMTTVNYKYKKETDFSGSRKKARTPFFFWVADIQHWSPLSQRMECCSITMSAAFA